MIHATVQYAVLHRACQIGKWAATSPTSGWSARAARWRASSWQLPEKIFPGQSRKWIKQERRLPGRRERCDRQRAVSLLLLVTFSHPPLPCMVGLVFSLLQLRRGRVRSARSRASLLRRSRPSPPRSRESQVNQLKFSACALGWPRPPAVGCSPLSSFSSRQPQRQMIHALQSA